MLLPRGGPRPARLRTSDRCGGAAVRWTVPVQAVLRRGALLPPLLPALLQAVLLSFYSPFYYPYYGYPYYGGFYGSFGWGFGIGYGFGYPYAYGYPYYGFGYGYGQYPYPYYGPIVYDNSGSARLQVTPRNTQVYIDGYFVGVVDSFDGNLQRLHVEAGEHELQLYLEGHRTFTQKVLFPRGGTLRDHPCDAAARSWRVGGAAAQAG